MTCFSFQGKAQLHEPASLHVTNCSSGPIACNTCDGAQRDRCHSISRGEPQTSVVASFGKFHNGIWSQPVKLSGHQAYKCTNTPGLFSCCSSSKPTPIYTGLMRLVFVEFIPPSNYTFFSILNLCRS